MVRVMELASMPQKQGIPRTIIEGEYVYQLHSGPSASGNYYYRCWRHRGKPDVRPPCPARLIFHSSNGAVEVTGGRHVSDSCSLHEWQDATRAREELDRLRETVHDMAQDRGKKPNDIYHEILFNIDRSRQGILPTQTQIQHWVHEARPSIAKSLSQVEEMRNVDDARNPGHVTPWLRRFDQILHIAEFALDSHLEYLRKARCWQIDGTFDARPEGWDQLLNIMACDDTSYLCCIHGLMKGKSENDYVQTFDAILQQLGPSAVAVQYITIDFELALYRALGRLTHNIQMFQDRRVAIKGCLFHFSQALYRKYIELNKKQKSQNLMRLFYLFIWLPFMKANEITKFLAELEIRDVTGCREYIDYFTKKWLPNLNWWIVDQRAPNCVQTNCGLESFHGQLNRALPQARPDILTLSETLLRLDNEKFSDISRGLSGARIYN